MDTAAIFSAAQRELAPEAPLQACLSVQLCFCSHDGKSLRQRCQNAEISSSCGRGFDSRLVQQDSVARTA